MNRPDLLDNGSPLAEVLRASQPYGLLSKTTVLALTALTSKVISTSLDRLSGLGFIQEIRVAKIEKRGRPEKTYKITEVGVKWLQANGYKDASELATSDPIELAHRYCQTLVSAQTSTTVDIEKIYHLADGKSVRMDIAIQLSRGITQFIEIEQKLDRNNIYRAVEKFRALDELFSDDARRQIFSTDVLFIFNIKPARLNRTLNVWRDALTLISPKGGSLSFKTRYTTLDAFVYDPGFENMERFSQIEKRNSNLAAGAATGSVQSYQFGLNPPTKDLLSKLRSFELKPIDSSVKNIEQLSGFCEIAMTIYRKSMHKDGMTRQYSAFPHESLQSLNYFFHLPENTDLLHALQENILRIEGRKTGLILYREAVTKLVWDVVLRYFGLGRGGPLTIYVGIPDLGAKTSEITIKATLDEQIKSHLPWTSAEESYEDAISWMLTALIVYPEDLGLLLHNSLSRKVER